MTSATRTRTELERSSRAPADARREVDRHRHALGEAPWQRARLLVSELTTNALRHGRGRIVLEVRNTGSALWVCVRDDGGGRARSRPSGEDGGFGLHLVDDFADRWGQGPGGGVVWFEVDCGAAAVGHA